MKKEDGEGREAIAQYMMRNVFNTQNITYVEKTGKVIFKTKMQKGKNKKNFVMYHAEEFIAAITQHIPKKKFRMTRYFGWYSNKLRGLRAKADILSSTENDTETIPDEIKVVDVSKFQPKNVPSLTWRECIKKTWKEDPLIYPKCFPLVKRKHVARNASPKCLLSRLSKILL